MQRIREIATQFGDIVKHAARDVMAELERGEIDTEPSLTDRLAERIKAKAEALSGVQIIIRTLGDRGPKAAEAEFGADICVVLHVEVNGYSGSKGFLAQAKFDGRDVSVKGSHYRPTSVAISSAQKLRGLKDQCAKMLEVTPDSFVFVYSTKGIVAIPAASVSALSRPGTLHPKPINTFFKEFIRCFIGDPRLQAHDDNTLRDLLHRVNARLGLLAQVTQLSSR